MQFIFVAPPAGTGAITFRTLIKEGPANEGAFYFPQEDLVLGEQAPSADDSKATVWNVAKFGQSCTEFCDEIGATCAMDDPGNEVSTPERHIELFSRIFPCRFPLIGECGVGSPAISVGTSYRTFEVLLQKTGKPMPSTNTNYHSVPRKI